MARQNLPRENLGGRWVTVYDPSIGLQICEQVAEGKTLKEVTAKGNEKGFPSRQTFNRWVVNEPDLARAYAAARELSAHSLEEEGLEMAAELRSGYKKDGTPFDSARVRAYDVALYQLRWSAAKRNPKVFGDKAQANLTVPIQINTTLNLGDGAGGTPTGDAMPADIYTIEAKVPVEAPSAPVSKDLMGEGDKPLVEHTRGGKPGRKAGSKSNHFFKNLDKPPTKAASTLRYERLKAAKKELEANGLEW